MPKKKSSKPEKKEAPKVEKPKVEAKAEPKKEAPKKKWVPSVGGCKIAQGKHGGLPLE